jgi:hypothetical protein
VGWDARLSERPVANWKFNSAKYAIPSALYVSYVVVIADPGSTKVKTGGSVEETPYCSQLYLLSKL